MATPSEMLSRLRNALECRDLTVEREVLYGDRSVQTEVSAVLFFRRLTVTYNRPIRRYRPDSWWTKMWERLDKWSAGRAGWLDDHGPER